MISIDSLAEKEEKLQFGIKLADIINRFDKVIPILSPETDWPIALRREYCELFGVVDQTKEIAKQILLKIEDNYSEVPTAEKYKTIINEKLAKLEELASHYRI
jgi:hypothetical protein